MAGSVWTKEETKYFLLVAKKKNIATVLAANKREDKIANANPARRD